MVEKIETNNMQLLYTLFTGGGGQGGQAGGDAHSHCRGLGCNC